MPRVGQYCFDEMIIVRKRQFIKLEAWEGSCFSELSLKRNNLLE